MKIKNKFKAPNTRSSNNKLLASFHSNLNSSRSLNELNSLRNLLKLLKI